MRLRPTMSATPAKEKGAEGGGQQGGRFDQSFLELTHMPHWLEQRHDYADNEKVVGIGEKAHPGDEHNLPMFLRDARVIHF